MITETRVLPDGEAVRCAPLLKPLYVWVGRRPDIHAAVSIINSCNASTDVVVNNVGLPQLLRRMRGVPQWQRFGVDTGVPVKTGWDVDEAGVRTHRVICVAHEGDGWLPEVVLTRSVVDVQWREKAVRSLAAMHVPLLVDAFEQ